MIYEEPVHGKDHDQECAVKLLQCLNDMGTQHTNAVLLTLDGAETITPYQHYPAQPYDFGSGHWRAFYHCHESNITDLREYGHFHFFIQEDNGEDWSHVIALSVDYYGQPINLFTTNRWVTSGSWFDRQNLKQQMQYLEEDQEDALPQSWFKYILLLFQDKITELLQTRDLELKRLCPHNSERCFIDRSIYYLSLADIDLKKQLSAVLS